MSDSRAQDEAAIQAVLVESYKAWEAGDADGMVADYTADATAVMTGSLRDSREVIRENMALAFEGPLKGSSTYNKQLSLRFLGRDAAIAVSESGILFAGPRNYGLFMDWVFAAAGTDWCLKAVAANGQPGFAAYRRGGGGYELHTLQVFTVTAEGISRNSVFQEPEVFASFGLAAALDAQGASNDDT